MWKKTTALISIIFLILNCNAVLHAGGAAFNVESCIDDFRRVTGCESVSAAVVN